MEDVKFNVNGIELAADLYLPEGLTPGQRCPAIVVGHGFSYVKEGLAIQGKFFSDAGYVALAIDYRSFGRSGGEVRGELFPDRQVEDLRSAITYLETRPEVDNDQIGLWGTSFGGALVLAAAALDRRAKATVAQVPIVNGREWMSWLRTPEQWELLLDALDEDRRRRFAGQPSARVPVAGLFTSNEICGMPTDAEVLGFMSGLPAVSPTWRQDIALESVDRILAFNPSATIGQIAPRAVCLIALTGYEVLHPLQPILKAYASADEPKKLVRLPYTQLGPYSEPGITRGLTEAREFFAEHLPVGHGVAASIDRSEATV